MRSELEHKLDAIFSQYIRYWYSHNGICTCYICGKKLPISEIQNGHCFGRVNRGTRWNENNCRPICIECNQFIETQPQFKDKLRDELGSELFEQLTRLAKSVVRFSDSEGLEMINFYKNKLKELT